MGMSGAAHSCETTILRKGPPTDPVPVAPKKQQKMSIGDFLNDQCTRPLEQIRTSERHWHYPALGSWADEMDTQPLPCKFRWATTYL